MNHGSRLPSWDRWWSRLARPASWIVIALALLTMAGWWTGSAAIVQVRPGWAPMQFNTAVSFVLSALALDGEIARKTRLSISLSLVTLGVVAAILAQYALGVDLRLDNLLATPFVTDATSHPGRMAPNAGFGFAALMVAVLLRHLSRVLRSGAWALAIAGVLSATVCALSLVTLISYVAGLPTEVGFRNFTAMALTAAIGLLILSLLSLGASLQLHRHKFRGVHVTWLPSSVGLAFAFFSVILWVMLLNEREKELLNEAQLVTQLIERAAEMRLKLAQSELSAVSVGATPGSLWLTPPRRDEPGGSPISGREPMEHVKMAGTFLRCGTVDGEVWVGTGEADGTWWGETSLDKGLRDFVGEFGHFGYQLKLGKDCVLASRGMATFTAASAVSRRVVFAGYSITIQAWPERLVHTTATTFALLLGLFASVIASLFVAELQLADARARELNSWIEGAPLGLFLVDAPGRISRVNQRALEIFGAKREDVAGSLVELWLPVGMRQSHPKHREEFQKHPTSRRMGTPGKVQIQKPDGSLRHVEIGIAPLTIGGKDFVLCAMTDVEHRVRAEAALKRSSIKLSLANEELRRFSSALSHDLRAPIRGMTTLASFVEEDEADSLGSESLEHLRVLRERGQMALRMVDGLLQLARQGADEPPEEVEFSALVMEAYALVAAPETFSLKISADVPPLITSRAALLQVIFNLMANAVRHHDKGDGRLLVEAEVVSENIEVRIADDGPGIPDKFKEDVFAVFRKLNKDDEGVGLGLSLVKKRVEMSGGEIHLEDAVPRGLVAVFAWPLRPKSKIGLDALD